MMDAAALRARTVGELLDAAFQVVRARYAELVFASIVIASPALVLSLLLPEDLQLLATWVQIFLLNYVTAASVVIVSNVYLGRASDPDEVYRRVFANFKNVFFNGLMQGMLIGIGTMLCFVPGVIMYILTFAMPVVAMLENKGPSDAFDRSSRLAEGQWWRIFSTMVVASIIVGLAQFGVELVAGLAGSVAPWITNVARSLVAIVLAPFPAVVATLLYYDLRIRKEAFDLQTLMDAMGPEPVVETPAV